MRLLAGLCAAAAILAACAPPSAGSAPAAATPAPPASAAGLAAAVDVRAVRPDRRWYTTPDGLFHDQAAVTVEFAADTAPGTPRLRVEPGGREVPLVAESGVRWRAVIDLAGLGPGVYTLAVAELVRGRYALVRGAGAAGEIRVSAPEYVVWTLDLEGDAAGDAALAETSAILDRQRVPATILWNPRVWTAPDLSTGRAAVMTAWAMERARRGDEIGLHLHAWTDFVRDAGVTPRLAPAWSGGSDGYDVPLTAFDERETRALIDRALALMALHGLPRPASFRAGGFIANAATLRAAVAAGFSVDSSATAAGTFGRLRLPWTLPRDAQPYRPSPDDANVPGDLPLLEVPNIAGNTYALSVATIEPTIRDDLTLLAPAAEVATRRRALTFVSHPGTIDSAERGAIEALFAAVAPLRYDRDSGPLRFVTLSQLAQAYSD